MKKIYRYYLYYSINEIPYTFSCYSWKKVLKKIKELSLKGIETADLHTFPIDVKNNKQSDVIQQDIFDELYSKDIF